MTELKTVMTRTYQDRDVRNVGLDMCKATHCLRPTLAFNRPILGVG